MLLPDKGFWLYTYKGGGFIPIKVRALYLLSFFVLAARPIGCALPYCYTLISRAGQSSFFLP
jgi:hypothetical protein